MFRMFFRKLATKLLISAVVALLAPIPILGIVGQAVAFAL